VRRPGRFSRRIQTGRGRLAASGLVFAAGPDRARLAGDWRRRFSRRSQTGRDRLAAGGGDFRGGAGSGAAGWRPAAAIFAARPAG